jgi:hypothetical protein
MKGANLAGVAIEKVGTSKRVYRERRTREEKLILRDAALETLKQAGWRKQDIEDVFGLTSRRVEQITRSNREFAKFRSAARI